MGSVVHRHSPKPSRPLLLGHRMLLGKSPKPGTHETQKPGPAAESGPSAGAAALTLEETGRGDLTLHPGLCRGG